MIDRLSSALAEAMAYPPGYVQAMAADIRAGDDALDADPHSPMMATWLLLGCLCPAMPKSTGERIVSLSRLPLEHIEIQSSDGALLELIGPDDPNATVPRNLFAALYWEITHSTTKASTGHVHAMCVTWAADRPESARLAISGRHHPTDSPAVELDVYRAARQDPLGLGKPYHSISVDGSIFDVIATALITDGQGGDMAMVH